MSKKPKRKPQKQKGLTTFEKTIAILSLILQAISVTAALYELFFKG